MKKFSKLFTLLLAVMMLFTTAKTVNAEAFDYTKVNGGTTTLKKHLVVDNDASIPAAEFTFTVAAGGTAAEATDETVTVYAGLNPEKVKVNGTASTGKVTFTAGESTTAGAANDGIADSTEKKYATKNVTLDFSDVQYDKPGVYRYTITENDPTSPFSVVGQKVTTVDVYVMDNNGTLNVTGYVAYDGTVTNAPKNTATEPDAVSPNPNGAEAGTKDDKFVNQYETYNLKVDKVIAGNQGDKEDTFAFTITIEGAGAGSIINVGTVDTGKKVPADVENTYTADATGKVEVKVTLGHNEQIVLTGIAKGATYTVKEDASTSGKTDDGYTVTGEVTTAKTLSADASETVTNTRTGVIPTGVMTAALPGALLVACATLYFIAKRKSDDEE